MPDVRGGEGDGARADARLLRGAETGGDGEQEVPLRAGQGPRRARAGIPDQRHPRHGPPLRLQLPRHLLRLPQDTEHAGRLPGRADFQGLRQAPRVPERHHRTCCCNRWRWRREEREHGGVDGRRRRREAARHARLLPRVGAARLSLRPRVMIACRQGGIRNRREPERGAKDTRTLFHSFVSCVRCL